MELQIESINNTLYPSYQALIGIRQQKSIIKEIFLKTLPKQESE